MESTGDSVECIEKHVTNNSMDCGKPSKEFFHITTVIKLATWGKSTKLPTDHYSLCWLHAVIIIKGKICDTVRFNDTVY